ncbi:MAG: TetR family transcriptional regulator [Candidatus Heimdallarchaeota archaeon]|nr:TetR family transcriptional regulator [Candidatus Heimdallarchaeota archaeon]
MKDKIMSRLRKDERKNSILQTALKLIAEEGFDSVSMRLIAEKEGVSEVILYRHFRNKYKILQEIFMTYAPKIIQSFRELLDTVKVMVTDLNVSLPHLAKLYINRIKKYPYFMRLIMKESGKIPEYLSKADKKTSIESEEYSYHKILYEDLKIQEVSTNFFKRCQKEGNLRKDLQPKDCTRTLLSIFLPLIIHSPLFPSEEPLSESEFEEVIARQIKIVQYAFIPPKKLKKG